MKNKIALIGAGNLGKRYMQAIATIRDIELDIFDISDFAIDAIPGFLNSNNCSDLKYHVVGYDKLLDLIDDKTLVISCTTAENRIQQLLDVIQRKPLAVIVEKPVAQKESDYLELIKANEIYQINMFVNFSLRMQEYYSLIKAETSSAERGVYISHLPKMGLFCVGIHQVDIFKWLFNLDDIIISGGTFEFDYEQKRKGFYDAAGSVSLSSGNFRAYVINSAGETHRTAQIITDEKVITLYEDLNILDIYNVSNKEHNREKTKNLFVSNYMPQVIANIFSGEMDKIELPTIENSFVQHKILFDYAKMHNISDLNFT